MRSDIVNIKILFGIGKVLGVTPIWLKTPKLLSKIYISVLILLATSGTFLSIKKRYIALSDLHMSVDQAFLESSECFSEMLFMLACFVGVICRGDEWGKFFHSFVRAEEYLHRLNYQDHGNMCVFVVRLSVIHLSFFSIHAYEIIVWEDIHEATLEYGYILYRISMYYQFFTVYVNFCLAEMLCKRYAFLNKLLEEALMEKSRIVVISNKDNQRVSEKLIRIQKTYTILYGVVQNVNYIFGWTLFFYFSTYVMNILVNINYVLKYTQTEDFSLNIRMLMTYVIYSVVYTISTVSIVMACDRVERCGRKMTESCYLHQGVLERSFFKDELTWFATFLKQLTPTFSAGGFFQINQGVLSALFSVVTTYLIIIIQFNMTL